MKFGFQMDPIGAINIAGDTSFALMLEAQKRGHEICVFEPRHVFYDSGAVKAATQTIEVADVAGSHFKVAASGVQRLDTFDVILIRQDPPFNTAYLANTFLLDLLADRVVMLNPPRAIRNFSEKMRVLELNRFMPRTFIGSSPADIAAFAGQFANVVVKPLFLGGGTSVVKTSAKDGDFAHRLAALFNEVGDEPIVVQEFIPQVVDGDKRVFVIDGAVAGVLRRVPAKGDFRANIHVGGAARLDSLTKDEEIVCREVSKLLVSEGIIFAGIDLIFGHLNEVNVTSPTLVREYLSVSGIDLAKTITDTLEARVLKLAKPRVHAH
jgi:glutathione synthase